MALRADDVDLGRDAALVLRFQDGDAAAFDDLYRRYFTRLRRFCERRVGDPVEAEELAQEAFARALRAMPSFAGERRFYPWMTVIASRLCVDSHRRRDRATPVAEIDLGVVEADLDELFAEVDRAHLAEALARLAPRHREVLDLRERAGWSYQQIADHYDVNLGTVEALLHRARRALRREFERVTGAAGDGRLAAAPAVGWCLRKVASLRTRAAAVADLATPLSATIASVALAAGSFVAAAPGSSADASARRTRPALVAAAHLTPAPPDVAADLPALAGATDPRPAASHPTTPASGPTALDVGRYETASRRNRTAPIHQEVDGVTVGLDPVSALTDTVVFATRVPGSLP